MQSPEYMKTSCNRLAGRDLTTMRDALAWSRGQIVCCLSLACCGGGDDGGRKNRTRIVAGETTRRWWIWCCVQDCALGNVPCCCADVLRNNKNLSSIWTPHATRMGSKHVGSRSVDRDGESGALRHGVGVSSRPASPGRGSTCIAPAVSIALHSQVSRLSFQDSQWRQGDAYPRVFGCLSLQFP